MSRGMKKTRTPTKAHQAARMTWVAKETRETPPTLTDDLMALVLAKLPFPGIFKARCLSKTWRYRLSPIPAEDDAQHDQDERLLAASFQAELRKRATGMHLGICFPIYVGQNLGTAYNWTSKSWVSLPSLSVLPKDLLDAGYKVRRNYRGAAGPGHVLMRKNCKDMIVANIFTGSWKLLPRRPSLVDPPSYPKSRSRSERSWPRLVADSSTGSYNVIAFTFGKRTFPHFHRYFFYASIYESRTNAWTTVKLDARGESMSGCPHLGGYLNGVMYMAVDRDLQGICTLNVQDGTSTIIPFTSADMTLKSRWNPEQYDLVVRDGQLYMLVYNNRSTIGILKVDLELRQFLEIRRSPPDFSYEDFRMLQVAEPVSMNGRYIIFAVFCGHLTKNLVAGLVAYDWDKDEWSRLETFEFGRVWTSLIEKVKEYEGRKYQLCCLDWDEITLDTGLDPFFQVS